MSRLSQGFLKIIILKHVQVQQLSVYQERAANITY